MSDGNLDNITQMEQMTDHKSLQKVKLEGAMPYISVISYGTDLIDYLDISLWQIDGYANNY